MKQYYPNPKLKRILERTQYKKHPKWLKRKWVRRMLAMIVPISGIIIYFYNINTPKPAYIQDELFIKVTNISIPLCMAIFFSIPYVAYRKILEGSCVSESRDRQNDILVITDEDLKYIYHPSDRSDVYIFEQLEMRYEDITEIIYSTYNQRVDIYGRRKELWYPDYRNGKYTRNKNVNKPGTRIRLYLYFEGNEEILKTLQERSTAEMKIIDYPTE
ncbi:hypothetical protein [Inconstantimicrobium mannanitabidum]|uniref:Uncharacterized protein n=1 Tax=Inconstantimicrobium mannanitabidum TaxID=1604901 RepID=A0ACB5R6N1_9CLOT|nr:hypothetical protein [Clostridium sp. TW13]GKX64776.1 hypothetical protein rsdtw13_00340 [Clostridium sp. TW13]